jgi:hypothetical protein
MSYRSGQDPEENLPDWLKDLRKRKAVESPPGEEGEGSELSGQEPGEEEPDWLREIRERYGHPMAKPEQPAVPGAEASLSDTQPIQPSRRVEIPPEPDEPIPEQQAFVEEAEVSEEPESAERAPVEDVPEVEEPPIEEPTVGLPGRDFPDWLQELGVLEQEADEEEQTQGHIPAFTEGVEDLTPGELPSWLEAIRPSGIFPEEDKRSEEMLPSAEENVGPLAGLSGVLPAEPEAIQSVKPPVYTARLELTDSQSQHVEVLKKLLEEEGKPSEDLSPHTVLPARLLNTVMSVALLLAVLIPIFNQSQLAPRQEPEALPESTEVFKQIDILPAEAPVLVAIDLQPAFYGEVKAAASAVLTHLLQREARLVFISTQPTGPATAERLLQEEDSSQPAVATGDYTNLGYLSGGMAALRSFLNDPRSATFSVTSLSLDPWSNPTLDAIEHVSDFALVVLVSSNAEDVRAWIEQSSAELPNGLVAITSAQAAPLLRPYLQSQPQTLKGMVSGVQGAVFYESLRAQDGDGRVMWDAYSFGLGAIALLILLGGLYGRAIHLRPERITEVPTSQEKESTEGKNAA